MGVAILMETIGTRSPSQAVRTVLQASVAALLLLAAPSHAFIPLTGNSNSPDLSGNTYQVHWNLAKKPSGIPFLIQTDAQGEGTTDILASDEAAVIRKAFQNWQNVSTSQIAYQYMGTTDSLHPGALDNINVVGFEKNGPYARAGVLALTVPTFQTGKNDPSRAGELVEADILIFDTARVHWMSQGRNKIPLYFGTTAYFNLEEIVTREVGHFNGLHASFVRVPYDRPILEMDCGVIFRDNRKGPYDRAALMYPYALNDSPVRNAAPNGGLLTADEVAGISALYPAESFGSTYGSIGGHVALIDTATPTLRESLCGAHVVAVDAGSFRPVVGTVSGPDGSYTIQGLPPGPYRVWVEPSSTGDIQGLYPGLSDAAMDFYSEFYTDVSHADRASAPTVSVTAGGTVAGIDVAVVKTVPNREVVYAKGGQTDQDGNRLIIRIEPDDTQQEATHIADANEDNLITINDTIQAIDDVDYFTFQAVRDDIWRIRVVAEEIGSSLDPRLRVFGPGFQAFPFVVDNTPGNDAEVTFTVPETAGYYIEVSHLGPVLDDAANKGFYTLVAERISGRIPVSPLCPPTAVLSFPLSDADLIAAGYTDPTFGHVEITELRVQFLDVDGDAGLDTDGGDFLPPKREYFAGIGGVESGFTLFVDDGVVPGHFDLDPANPDQSTQDSSIRMREAPTIKPFAFGFEVTFVPDEPVRLAAQRMQDEIADFHVVVKTSATFHHGDDFQAVLPKGGVVLRVNGVSGAQTVKVFAQDFPPPLERNKYTGDIVSLTAFIPDGGASVNARSNDFPVIGLNLVGDPAEQYWLSQIELTFVGYNLTSLLPHTRETFLSEFVPFGIDPRIKFRTWEMTDLLPFTDGDTTSGGVNVYFDNDPPGAAGDGVPNFGLNGDYLLPFAGNQRFEVVPLDTIPDDIILDLYPILFSGTWGQSVADIYPAGRPPTSRAVLEEDEFLALRNDLNIVAFKAILPLRPNPALAVPPDDKGANFGPDMFITVRTSNQTQALDVFIPYIQVDGIQVKSDLDDVIANGGDPSFSSLVNGGSLRKIDPTSKPNTTMVEVIPNPLFTFKDLVNPEDIQNRGALIGSASEGSPILGVIGIDAIDFYNDAMRTPNLASDDPEANDQLNRGVVLDSLKIIIDPVERPASIPLNFVRPVEQTSFKDPVLLGLPRSGLTLHVDDNTPAGNYIDDDNDGLFDEELVNESDDDLDGFTDENDFGDEDGTGTQGQLDPTDDIISYLQQNDVWREGGTQYVAAPVVTQQQDGSLLIDYPDLTVRVLGEVVGDHTLVADPFTVFFDSAFHRTDHYPVTVVPDFVTIDLNPAEGIAVYQRGFMADYSTTQEPLAVTLLNPDNPVFNTVIYDYLTEVPNSNAIPEFIGSDFFVAVRMGSGAISGDTFRMRIPENGLKYSFYQDPGTVGRSVRRGSVREFDFSSSQVRVGTGNVPPTLTFEQPGVGQSDATGVEVEGRLEFDFEVVFNFSDPDNDATVDFFYDGNNFGADGEPVPFIQNQQTANIVDNDGRETLRFTFRFPPDLANDENAEAFIYGVVTDDVNPRQAVYSNGSIVIEATERAKFSIQDYIIADNIGQIFGTGGSNANIPDLRQTQNIIRDLELTPSERGALFLTGYGEVVMRGDPDPWSDFVRTSNSVTFPEGGAINLGMDLARDIVPDFRRNGYYLLDALGTVHAVGAVPPPEFPLIGAPSYSQDLARDMETTSTGLGLYILSGRGPVTAMGDARPIEGGPGDFGFDIARDIDLTRRGDGLYLLDGYGSIFPLGGAKPLDTTQIPLFLGSDMYRAIETTPAGSGLLVMDREGQVFGAGQVFLGPNAVRAGTIPPPPGFRKGEFIDFSKVSPPTNVVKGEVPGAFIDLETVGIGALADLVGDTTICQFVVREDLAGLLDFYETRNLTVAGVLEKRGFLDDQGHDLDDVTANWKAFFDFYDVVACRIPSASLTVREDPQQRYDQGDVLIMSGSWEILAFRPSLRLMAPDDDPAVWDHDNIYDPDVTLDEIGEPFTFPDEGPLPFDQLIRFWEVGDGRGWHLKIIDDDNVEDQIDAADRVLAERDFFKMRQQRRREGSGSLFLSEEDDNRSSRNGQYIFQFIEMLEAPETDPTGGWHGPLLFVQWYNEAEDEEGRPPYVTFKIPFQFDILVDAVTGRSTIIGGECATFAMLPLRSEGLEYTQDTTFDDNVAVPAGWRFFDALGVTIDPDLDTIYESHLFYGPDEETFTIPDTNSSAMVISLTSLLNVNTIRITPNVVTLPEDYVVPLVPFSSAVGNNIFRLNADGTVGRKIELSDMIPLKESLMLDPKDMLRISFTDYTKDAAFDERIDLVDGEGTVLATAWPDDFLVAFRKDDQRRFPQYNKRLYYATFRVKNISPRDDEELVGDTANVIFTWHFDPDTNWIPFNSFKKGPEGTKRPEKEPATLWSPEVTPVKQGGRKELKF